MAENKDNAKPEAGGKKPAAPAALTPFERVGGCVSLVLCSVFLGSVVYEALKALGMETSNYAVNATTFLLNALIAVLVFHRFLFKSLPMVTHRFGRFLATAVVTVLIYLGAEELMAFLASLCSVELNNANNDLVLSLVLEHPVVMCLCVCLLVPLAEECLWRGLVFGELRRVNRMFAYVVTMTLFALLHVWQFIGVYSVPNLLLVSATYLPAGAALAWAYDRSETIWCPILAHSCINAIVCTTALLGL